MSIALVLLLLADPGLSLESRVNVALDRSAVNLIGRQHADGSWNKEDKVHPLGRTALCTYALLHAGIARDHDAVQKGIGFLSGKEPRSTYEAGCMLLLYHALGRSHDKRKLFRQHILDQSVDDLQRVAAQYLRPELASTAIITSQTAADENSELVAERGLEIIEL